MLTKTHLDRLKEANDGGAKNVDTEAYLASQGAIFADGHAYWIEDGTLWGLTAGRTPGWESCQRPAPWTVAMWDELQRLRPLVDGATIAAAHQERDKAAQDRDEALRERDAALAEVTALHRVIESAGQQIRGFSAVHGGFSMKWSDHDRLGKVADFLIGPEITTKSDSRTMTTAEGGET